MSIGSGKVCLVMALIACGYSAYLFLSAVIMKEFAHRKSDFQHT